MVLLLLSLPLPLPLGVDAAVFVAWPGMACGGDDAAVVVLGGRPATLGIPALTLAFPPALLPVEALV